MRTGCKLVDINGHLLRGCLHEDKTFRRRCGHLAGKELLSVEEINEKKGNNNKQGGVKMNRRRKFQLVVNVIVSVIFGLCLSGAASAESASNPVKIVIHDPGMSRGYTHSWEWWAKEVEKQTNGEVTFEILWGGPLGGYVESLDNVKNGVYDMSMVPPTYMPAKLPLWTAFEVPFITRSMWAFAMTMWDMKDMPVLKKEYEQHNVKPLIPVFPASFELMSEKKLTSLADLKGLKVRAYGMFAEVLEHFGANCSSMASTEIYENMQRGVIDAAICGGWPDQFVLYGIYEAASYALLLRGFGYIVLPLSINLDTWNKISPKNQEIMTKLARKTMDKLVELTRTEGEPYLAKIKEKGIVITKLSDPERDQMAKYAKTIWEGWVEKQVKAGRPQARMVMDTIITKVKEYEQKDPYKDW